jgi:hypothetical protein
MYIKAFVVPYIQLLDMAIIHLEQIIHSQTATHLIPCNGISDCRVPKQEHEPLNSTFIYLLLHFPFWKL